MKTPEEQERIKRGRNDETRKLNFLIVGQSGAGKSTTINRLLDGCKDSAKCSDPGSVASNSVTKVPKIYNMRSFVLSLSRISILVLLGFLLPKINSESNPVIAPLKCVICP